MKLREYWSNLFGEHYLTIFPGQSLSPSKPGAKEK